jgi:hypothetical protein
MCSLVFFYKYVFSFHCTLLVTKLVYEYLICMLMCHIYQCLSAVSHTNTPLMVHNKMQIIQKFIIWVWWFYFLLLPVIEVWYKPLSGYTLNSLKNMISGLTIWLPEDTELPFWTPCIMNIFLMERFSNCNRTNQILVLGFLGPVNGSICHPESHWIFVLLYRIQIKCYWSIFTYQIQFVFQTRLVNIFSAFLTKQI